MNAAAVIAEAFTTEIVGNSDDHNGGRLSAKRSHTLATTALDALAAAGFAVVRLPEPVFDDALGTSWGPGGIGIERSPKGNLFVRTESDRIVTPSDARDLAAALLAAASLAEEAGR